MKGGFGCSPCCGPTCEECTRECTEPHTGDPFETKYTLYFEGVEIGNPGGVYLQASGDVDTSDPYDGMDGNGPWGQTVSSIFSLSPTMSRIPCVFRASFWRSNFVLGANTVPPPAATLIGNEIEITNEASSEGAILYGDVRLEPGESYTITGSIPVVSGAGDQSTNDPRSAQGSISIRAACGNHAVSFSVSARIAWDVKKRQHVLYGLVRECYEDPNGPDPCAGFCAGSSVPDDIYVEITNFAMDPNATFGASNVAGVNGTYVLSREAGYCKRWVGPAFGSDCKNGRPPAWVTASVVDTDNGINFGGFSNTDMVLSIHVSYTTTYQGGTETLCAYPLALRLPAATLPELCGTGVLASGQNASGTAKVYRFVGGEWGSNVAETISCTFDWKITA